MSEQHSEQGHHHPRPLSPSALRAKAIEALLVEKGLLASDVIDRIVETYEKDVGPLNGATGLKLWHTRGAIPTTKGGYSRMGRRRSQNSASAASKASICRSSRIPRIHNVVCCTLCSCYPWPVLGLPPVWYKSFEYRARMVREPRAVLHEFGLDLPPNVELRVWDSSSEVRYLVLAERPPDTEGMSEAELVALVTRDSMIGVAKAGRAKG